MANTQYDVIVVGAGIAGLTCANYLALGGKRVLLLEHNHQAGGLMGGFWRKGFYFDAGDQSFESGGFLFPILKELGIYDKIQWEFADYALSFPQGDVVFRDKKKVVSEFGSLFPREQDRIYGAFEGLERYVEPMEKVFTDDKNPLFLSGLPRWRGLMESMAGIFKYRKELKETITLPAGEYADRHLPGYGFKEKFSQFGYRNMPMFLGIGFWHSWFVDYWYPKGGLQSMHDMLVERFENLGGEVQFRQRVEQILVEKERAAGVQTHKGDAFTAPWVVFAGATQRLYTDYLPGGLVDPGYVSRIREAKLSEPLNALYLGVDISTAELGKVLKTHHTFRLSEEMFRDLDDFKNPDLHKDCFLEINWTSRSNPKLAPEGMNSLVLETMTAHGWMNRWGTGGDDFKRTPRYRQLKKVVAEQMIDAAERVIPNLKSRIVYQDLGTPMSTIRYTLNPEGASAGWTYDHDNTFLKGKYLDMFTPVRRLLTIGHYAIWPGGVPFSALTGLLAARVIQNERFVEPALDLARLIKRLRGQGR